MWALSLRQVIPGLTVIVATLAAALPWGLPAQARFLMPLLPYATIHFWAVRRPAQMPEWLVFLAGLAIDVLTNGPLGFWSLIYLIGLMCCHALWPPMKVGAFGRWLQFGATLIILATAEWLLASAFFMSAISWQPFFGGALFAVLVYPFIGLALRPIDRLWPSSDNPRFERGV